MNKISLLFSNLNKIFDKKQKKSAFSLLFLMIIGMVFEIFLLNTLVILLNFLTNSQVETPAIIKFIENFGIINKINLLVLILFIFAFLLKTLTTIVIRWKEAKFIYSIKAQISEKFFHGYLNLPFIFHQRTNTSKLLKNVTFEIDQLVILVFAISTLLLEFIVLTGISGYLIFFNFKVSTVCIIAFLAFGYIFNTLNKKKIRTMGKERIFHQDEKIKSLIEGFTGMREIKLQSKESNIIKSFSFHNNLLSKISISTSIRSVIAKPSFEIFMLIIMSIFIIYFIMSDTLTAAIIPTIGLYLAASYRLVPSIANIVQSVQTIQFNFPCAKILRADIEKFERNKINSSNSKIKQFFKETIELKNLSFSYDQDKSKEKNNILENINLTIKKGDCIGIQGKSGSGKSTLIDILIGLHPPDKGQILIDGKDIKLNIKGWQRLIGCVPQEVFIIDDTLKKNIAFGVPEKNIDPEKIKKSLDFGYLSNFLLTLEHSLETVIGEKGSRLSGGQKQRIGIARAIYNDPEILIFDESTSSLDIESEEKIISEINSFKKKKTVIIVSHKKNTLKNCDYIYEINGRNLREKSEYKYV